MSIHAKKTLEKTLHRLSNKLVQDEVEIFYKSHRVEKYLNTLTQSVIGKSCSVPIVYLYYTTADWVAYTDGNIININVASDIIKFFPTTTDKFIGIVGLLYHELAHCLYTDFSVSKEATEQMKLGKSYQTMPKEPAADIREVEDAFRQYPLFFRNICKRLENYTADVHDENRIIEDYGDFAEVSILKTRESLRRQSATFEDIDIAYRCGNTTMLQSVLTIVFEYARFERIVAKSEDELLASEYWQHFCCVSKDIEALCREDDTKKRYEIINAIIVKLWSVIKEEIKNLRNPQQSPGNSGTQPEHNEKLTDSQIDEALDKQLQSAAETVQQGKSPQNRNNSEKKEKQKKDGNQCGKSEKAEEKAQEEANRIIKSAALDRAGSKLEESHSKEMVFLSREVSEKSNHKGIPLQMNTEELTNYAAYEGIHGEIRQYVKTLSRRIKEALRDIEIGENKRHRIFGREIDVRDVYRPDKLFFSQKKLPSDMPDIAIGILVDNSGSMRGERIEAAVKACIMLYEFGCTLGVSTGVFGHSTFGDVVSITRFCEFDEYKPEQKYRIAAMTASGCNRDGLAVLTIGSELALRSEPMKLLFVISDGQPNHDDYSGEAAETDIQNICSSLKKRGVSVIGCAIGDDREQIERIYKDRCLDISDLSLLPKTLTKLVRQKILSEL